jgi:glycosyltransferase involved in cell wall biosynthesis
MAATLPRIVVDLEKLRHINTGLGRVALHLGAELLTLAPGRFDLVFLLPPGAARHLPSGGFGRIDAVESRRESLMRLVRPLVRPFLPPPDVAVWHVTHQTAKYLPLDPRIPVLLTIHDLNFLHESPGERPGWRIARKLAAVQALIDRSAAVSTDSQFVADDVAAHLELGGRPVHVVPLGLAPPAAVAPGPPAWLAAEPFLLSVGNFLPHKNFHVLLGLLERLPGRRLIVAGKHATPYGDFLRRESAARGLDGRVLLPGEVSDSERQWLYEHCEAFVFPSLSEGFGFPVLEAMQAGRPVIMARATSLPEIAGDAGFYFDSFEPDSMAAVFTAGMQAWAADPESPERARRHAAGYSWAATAARYADIYDALIRAETRSRRA